jgi:hypothetical protein
MTDLKHYGLNQHCLDCRHRPIAPVCTGDDAVNRTSDHIIVNSDTGCFECHHCGASYKPALPCSITMYLGMSRTFIREHRICLPPALSAPMTDLPMMLRPQAD